MKLELNTCYIYGIYVHGNLYIFVAQVQVIFITSTIARQNYLLTRTSLKKSHWGSKKLPLWNAFTNLRWLHSRMYTPQDTASCCDGHLCAERLLRNHNLYTMTCPVASGENALLSPPGSNNNR